MNFDFIKNINFASATWVFAIPTALMAIDCITGLLNAWAKDEIKSAKMRQGLVKKFGEIVILVMGEMFTVGLTLPSYIMSGVSAYVIFMEFVSICENLDKMGVPIPRFIKKSLDTAQDAIDGELSEETKQKLKESISNKKSGGEQNE